MLKEAVPEVFPIVHTVSAPPVMFTEPVLSNLPATLIVPPDIENDADELVVKLLPAAVPMLALPDIKFQVPLFVMDAPVCVKVPPLIVILLFAEIVIAPVLLNTPPELTDKVPT